MNSVGLYIANFDYPRLLKAPIDRKVKKPRTTIVMLHGIGNSAAGWDMVKEALPKDARLIAIDLLGFGSSPKPAGASYSVRVQARSVAATLLKMGLTTRVVLVGHSMGSLVAVELAKRYPLLVRGMVLCAPPIYRDSDENEGIIPNSERVLKKVYSLTAKDAVEHPDFYIGLSKKVANVMPDSSTFSITDETVAPYVATLKTSIINQTTYLEIQKLNIATYIIYGTLDPFVVNKNFKKLAKNNSNIKAKSIIASHEITKAYLKPITESIEAILK